MTDSRIAIRFVSGNHDIAGDFRGRSWSVGLLLLMCCIYPGIWMMAADISESLTPLGSRRAPQTIKELWQGYDPAAEPLETVIIKQWEEQDVVCRLIRFRIGTFKGVPAFLAAFYGFPKGAHALPALEQVHGGGQSANLNVILTNAHRGYASLSINWGGNPISVPGANTEWGSIDATQNSHNDHYYSIDPDAKTIDPVASARNNNWFLLVLAARRGLTFLAQQPEVDANRLGIYGHSMGGKVSFDTAAIDGRVKVAVPSCGAQPNSDFPPSMQSTIASIAYAPFIHCPILFLNPSNDFHGTIDGIETTIDAMPKAAVYSLSRVPHLNHRDKPDHLVCGPLWLDMYLQDSRNLPKIPKLKLEIDRKTKVPVLHILPDQEKWVVSVEVLFSHGGDGEPTTRFWRQLPVQQVSGQWHIDLPVFSLDLPLRYYVNVTYLLPKPVVAAGYYYQTFTADRFSLASRMVRLAPEKLHELGLAIAAHQESEIESFSGNWGMEWFTFDETGDWPLRTFKLHDPQWAAPVQAALDLDVQADEPNHLILSIGDAAADVPLVGGSAWQHLSLRPGSFINLVNGSALSDWKSIAEFSLGPLASANKDGQPVQVGGPWHGVLPKFRHLKWETAPGTVPIQGK